MDTASVPQVSLCCCCEPLPLSVSDACCGQSSLVPPDRHLSSGVFVLLLVEQIKKKRNRIIKMINN